MFFLCFCGLCAALPFVFLYKSVFRLLTICAQYLCIYAHMHLVRSTQSASSEARGFLRDRGAFSVDQLLILSRETVF